ncbi:MAG: hypothetical protein SPL79_06645, partial [Sphaerochaetaceae bacterium]|nr:hypothetical protein [Sphaerochaetaceae bacterium]
LAAIYSSHAIFSQKSIGQERHPEDPGGFDPPEHGLNLYVVKVFIHEMEQAPGTFPEGTEVA